MMENGHPQENPKAAADISTPKATTTGPTAKACRGRSGPFRAPSALHGSNAVVLRPSVNTRGMPPEIVARIAHATAQAYAEYGEDPATLEQAAAHEAGHVIVAFALGGKPRKVRVFRESHCGRTIWLGENAIGWRWAAHDYPFAFASDVPRAFDEMVYTLGGLMGEQAAGLGHPSSSIDERCIATMGAKGLAPLLGCATIDAAALIEQAAMRAIHDSRAAFDELRAALRARHRLDRFEIARILRLRGAKRMHVALVAGVGRAE
jgi:hypothetical protein